MPPLSPRPRRAVEIRRAKARVAEAVIDEAKLGGFDWLTELPWDEALAANKSTREFMSDLMSKDLDVALVSVRCACTGWGGVSCTPGAMVVPPPHHHPSPANIDDDRPRAHPT